MSKQSTTEIKKICPTLPKTGCAPLTCTPVRAEASAKTARVIRKTLVPQRTSSFSDYQLCYKQKFNVKNDEWNQSVNTTNAFLFLFRNQSKLCIFTFDSIKSNLISQSARFLFSILEIVLKNETTTYAMRLLYNMIQCKTKEWMKDIANN